MLGCYRYGYRAGVLQTEERPVAGGTHRGWYDADGLPVRMERCDARGRVTFKGRYDGTGALRWTATYDADSGRPITQAWYRGGKLDRADGPAFIVYNFRDGDGTVQQADYYDGGRLLKSCRGDDVDPTDLHVVE
jgi:hypothetical protein